MGRGCVTYTATNMLTFEWGMRGTLINLLEAQPCLHKISLTCYADERETPERVAEIHLVEFLFYGTSQHTHCNLVEVSMSN